MKRLIGFVALAVAFASAWSCQKGEAEPEVMETVVSVQIPGESDSRTVSMAEKTDIVYFEVWDESFQNKLFPYPGSEANHAEVKECRAEIILQLVKDQTFNLIFWAQNEKCGAYSWENLKNIKVDYAKFTADQKDVYDAFYAVMDNMVADGESKIVRLYRPFAQINFGASGLSTSIGDIELSGNSVTVSEVASTFNTVSGMGADPVSNVTFTTESDFVEDRTIEVGAKTYDWVAMNYLLVASGESSKPSADVTVSADFVTNFGAVHHYVTNVPIERNYRTNIVGDLFRAGAKLNIIVVPDFKGDKPVIEINQ